ncbi:MAG: response regulator transcription factor [Acidimicrobiia bacterium]
MPTVLLIEDDQRIRQLVATRLADHGFAVRTAAAGLAGLEDLLADPPDAIVLDLGLPDVDGVDLLRMIRTSHDLPIVVATARDDEEEIVAVLDAGADDYVVKPFSAEHLAARLRAVLRRSGDRPEATAVTVGGLEVDSAGRLARLDGEPLDLTRKEFDLLEHLARHAGQVVSRRELLASVWNQPYGGSDKTIDVHLSWLRRKLGETADAPRYLHTVRGVGIRLEAPGDR